MSQFIPKIKIEGSTSNEPFVKFTQNYSWTSSNFCLHVDKGYTNLNGLIINGLDTNDTIYTSNTTLNMSFNVTGNSNLIFKTNNIERLRILNSGNVGIGTTISSEYKLNVNGSLNSTSFFRNGNNLDNIYLLIKNNFWLLDNISPTSSILYTDPNSNIDKIGIGNTSPLGYLHLGSTTNAGSDANIILSKTNLANTNRNFKIGYDTDFNFVFGDFGDASTQTWKKQFYINSSAPDNSLIILDNGNIGIGTTNTNNFKVNINGNLYANSITADGANLTNLNYNRITTGKPDIKNLDNWTIDSTNTNFIYNRNAAANSIYIGIGTTSLDTAYRLNVYGPINSTDYFINGKNINTIYLTSNTALTTYLTLNAFTASEIWTLGSDSDGNHIKLNSANIDKKILLGRPAANVQSLLLLDVYGTTQSRFFIGNGNGITNINYNNITTNKPDFLLKTEANASYYNRTYFDTTYSNILQTKFDTVYGSISAINSLNTRINSVYSSVDPQAIGIVIQKLAGQNSLIVYHSNILELPYIYDSNNKTLGFNTTPSTNSSEIITINGNLTGINLKAIGNIYENNTLLSNIYVSSNNYHKSISNYDKIIDRIKSSFTNEELYPPLSSLFTNNSNIISNKVYGNGTYIIQSSTNLLYLATNDSTYETIPAFNLFNYTLNTALSWQNNVLSYNSTSPHTLINNTYNETPNTSNILYNNINTNIYYGHWILLYYSEKFIASKIDIVTTSSFINNSPKKITLLATNSNVIITREYINNYRSQQNASATDYIWDIIINNYEIAISSYINIGTININTFILSASIPIINNIKAYNCYKLIITEVQASSILQIQQLKFYGFENKKEWKHSGNNIYSLSNISIGTIDNLSPYLLNVNGDIYSSSNIYSTSNIGIGNTSPLGNLHIASPNNISDGTLIISKKDNNNNRNFKFGYDSNFNFVLGDFGTAVEGTRTWTKQFYINSNAPDNSLMINSFGNIGIGTSNITSNQKLFINGNVTITGIIKQTDYNISNTFNSDIYASNNIYISSNLNVSNIFTSNINVSNYINVNGVVYVSKNIGIGTSTNYNASLNIQSDYNTIGIWNASYNLGNTQKISSFIGKNNSIKNGFYNYYYHNNDLNNNNYLSWTTDSNNTESDILSITANKNVGIGVTNPTSLFQIGSGGGKFKISPSDNDYALIGLNNTDNNNNTKIYLNGVNKRIEYHAYTGGHIFYTYTTEKMRINNISGNISIGDTSDIYKLSVNGNIYSSSNIYATSNIGIGITTPLGNLHIASPFTNSDGILIISKKNITNNRNFKIGYDENFNFSFGDFGDASTQTWKKQFYINYIAPSNSLLINSIGNIGIANIAPLGNLHIASPENISDGTLIISKKDNRNNRNFKFGYDENFNFVFGDFDTAIGPQIWKKQFYINSNASNNSLTINNAGYIGIGTFNNSLNEQILYVNGKTTLNGNTIINGSLSQFAGTNGYPNNFQNSVCINTTDSENYKLNVNGDVNFKLLLNASNVVVNNDMTILNGKVRVGISSTASVVPDYSVYIQRDTCINGAVWLKNANFTHESGDFNINSTIVNIRNNTYFGSRVGIGFTTGIITNILQIGNGGQLRISNDDNDYTVLGTAVNVASSTNTRIIINGSSKFNDINNKGNIEYYTTTSAGKHIFYKGGTSNNDNELMRIHNNGNVGIGTTNSDNYKLNVNGTINCISLISSNSINIGADALDKTNQLNVYGSIYASSNAIITSNIITSNIFTSNINNTGSLSNIGNLFITGAINQTGTYNFSGTAFNIGIISDNTKFLTVGGNISSSKDIIAHSNLITTTIKSVFSSNTSNLYTSNLIVSGSTILNSNIIQYNSFPITLTGAISLNSSTLNEQIIINNTAANKNATIKFTNNNSVNGYIGIGGTNGGTNYINNVFIQSTNNIILNTGDKNATSTPSFLINNLGKVGISTNVANNILQIGDGGRLRIANDASDYTVIGTIDSLGATNTRIIINGNTKLNDLENRGNIEYYTTNTTGKHIFYKGGTSNNENELMRIDNNGNVGIGTINPDNFKLNVNGQLNVSNLIRENGDYLSNIYVKQTNLNNLAINNFNLKKKYGFNVVTKGFQSGEIIFNSSNYYKFDIDLRNNTKNLVNTIGQNSVCYRSFNIKCFLTDCSFETFNNGIPNILQYDIYMSSNPINTPLCFPQMVAPKTGLNICAIGTPENYKLDNILPSYITLLRHNNTSFWFNYLSIVSPCSNLQVSYIIEDYLS
jgi:hypothetical protein